MAATSVIIPMNLVAVGAPVPRRRERRRVDSPPMARFGMNSSTSLRRVVPCRLLLATFALALSACSGGYSRRSDGGQMGPGDGGKFPPVPRMEATGMFFGGSVEAEVLLARTGARWIRDEKSGDAGDSGQSHSGHFGGGGGMGGHGGGRHGGGRGESEGGGTGDTGPQSPPIHAINQPGVQLRLRLTNHGSVPIVVEVLDFNSDLGGFVVTPEKIEVAPGASVEADPMVSRLGVSAAEIPLTVRMRVGGGTERKILALKVVEEPPPHAPGPAAPASAVPAASPRSQ